MASWEDFSTGQSSSRTQVCPTHSGYRPLQEWNSLCRPHCAAFLASGEVAFPRRPDSPSWSRPGLPPAPYSWGAESWNTTRQWKIVAAYSVCIGRHRSCKSVQDCRPCNHPLLRHIRARPALESRVVLPVGFEEFTASSRFLLRRTARGSCDEWAL